MLSIRFLRQGSINVPKPCDFDTWTQDKQLEWAEDVISNHTDLELVEAMSDYPNTELGLYFDEAPQVACIEDAEDEYNKVYTTPEWQAFIGAN